MVLKLLDQAILQGLVGALDAALRLRRVGAQNVDVERVQRAPELGHAVTLDRPGAIDPKDAVLVAVERDRLAMRLEIHAWDADATAVTVSVPEDLDEGAEISINDD